MTETFLQMAIRHRATDMLSMKGNSQFEIVDGKSCSVGCFNHDYGNAPADFAALAKCTGYPEWVHHFQEAVFEELNGEERVKWHVQFAEKCANVKDWDRMKSLLHIAILKIALPQDTSNVVQRVIDLHRYGGSNEDWIAARIASSAAWIEAESEASSAARSAAESAARSAASSAAESEASSAARIAAWCASWSASWREMRNDFLEAAA